MDELIILIIKGLAKLFGADQPKKPAQPKGPPLPPMRAMIAPNAPRQQQPVRSGGRRRRQAQARPAPPQAVTDTLEVVSDALPAAPRASQFVAPPAAATAHKAVSVNAVAIHQWLNPATLRKQFILTEILQPPLALREDR